MATAQIPQIQAQVRKQLGSRYAGRIRAEGKLPAVIYGHKQDPVHVTVDRKQVFDLLHHHAHLVEIVVDSTTEPCLIKDVQWNHLGTDLVHLDLTRVSLDERVTVEVEIELHGEPAALKETGAILEQPVTVIEIETLATNIPDMLHVNIEGLTIDEPLTAGDLNLPEGITTTLSPDTIIAAIHIVEEEPEEELVSEGEAAEPELIGKADEEEGDEGEVEEK